MQEVPFPQGFSGVAQAVAVRQVLLAQAEWVESDVQTVYRIAAEAEAEDLMAMRQLLVVQVLLQEWQEQVATEQTARGVAQQVQPLQQQVATAQSILAQAVAAAVRVLQPVQTVEMAAAIYF